MVSLDRVDDPARWDDLVRDASGATPFHRWAWLQGHARLNGWRFEPLVAVEAGSAVGVVPLLLTRVGPLWREAPVPFPYVGPLVPPQALDSVLEATGSWARRHGVAVTRADLAPGSLPDELLAAGPLPGAPGWTWERASTYVIDLSHGSVEQFQRGVSRNLRRSVQRAERAGAVVGAATREQVTQWLPALLTEAFGARDLPSPYPGAVGELVWNTFAGDPDVFLGSATVDGRPAGLLVGIAEGDTTFAWAGGGFRGERELSPNALLHHELALWAVARGSQRLDLVGSVDPGVARFKMSLGARETPFAIGTRVHSRLWSGARSGQRRLKALLPGRAGRGGGPDIDG